MLTSEVFVISLSVTLQTKDFSLFRFHRNLMVKVFEYRLNQLTSGNCHNFFDVLSY